MIPPVLEQFERVNRLLKRIEEKPELSGGHTENQKVYEDDLWCFFINCHHLRDWAIKDDEVEISPDETKTLYEDNPCLQRCRDIANGRKHMIPVGAEVSGKSVNIGAPVLRARAEVSGKSVDTGAPVLGSKGGWSKYQYHIATKNGKIFDALDTAKEAVEVWRRFLEKKKLI